MGLLDAFSKTGHGRPPALEDIPNIDFEIIFGREPRLPSGGGRVNLRHFAAIRDWRKARRGFDRLIDFELDEALAILLMETTQGALFAWQNKRGDKFLAVTGGPMPLYHVPLRLFNNPNIGHPEVYVWASIVGRGGCVPGLPLNHPGIPVMAEMNQKNCGK